jgi:hypothetical protein
LKKDSIIFYIQNDTSHYFVAARTAGIVAAFSLQFASLSVHNSNRNNSNKQYHHGGAICRFLTRRGGRGGRRVLQLSLSCRIPRWFTLVRIATMDMVRDYISKDAADRARAAGGRSTTSSLQDPSPVLQLMEWWNDLPTTRRPMPDPSLPRWNTHSVALLKWSIIATSVTTSRLTTAQVSSFHPCLFALALALLLNLGIPMGTTGTSINKSRPLFVATLSAYC